MSMPIRVLIIDSQPMVRLGLSTAIDSSPEMEVIGEASTGAGGLDCFKIEKPDVTILSLRLPDMCAVEDLEQFLAVSPGAKILILAEHTGDSELKRVIELGAMGILTKTVDRLELLDAIKSVAVGRQFLSSEAAEKTTQFEEQLTGSQNVVLRMMVGGMSNKEIAFALDISENTVKTHVRHIFEKLGVSDRTTATITAIKRGLVRVDV